MRRQISKISFWNVNCDRRQTPKFGFNIPAAIPECAIENRLSGILAEVKEQLQQPGSTFVLFEITDDIRIKIVDFAKANGWNAEFAKYNLSIDSYNYIVLTNGVEIREPVLLPLTKSGKPYEGVRDKSPAQLDECLGEEYEKGVFRLTVGDVGLFVIHLGLRNDSKLLQMAKLSEYTGDYQNALVIGDFNSFDSRVGQPTLFSEQFQQLLASGHLTEKIPWTFDNRTFPYDLLFKMTPEDKAKYEQLLKGDDIPAFRQFLLDLPNRYTTVSTALDHAFAKGIACSATAESLPNLSDHSIINIVLE
jgi:hypothetical protein